MNIIDYLISVAILLIPLIWNIKLQNTKKLSIAGYIFVFVVVSSIIVKSRIERYNIEKEIESKEERVFLLSKIDSLNFQVDSFTDSIMHLEKSISRYTKKFDSSTNYLSELDNRNDSLLQVIIKDKRPILMLTKGIIDNSKQDKEILLELNNIGKRAATRISGKIYIILRSKENYDDFHFIASRSLPFNRSEIIPKNYGKLLTLYDSDLNFSKLLDEYVYYFYIKYIYQDILTNELYSSTASMRYESQSKNELYSTFGWEHDKLKVYLNQNN